MMSVSWKKLREGANRITGFQLPIIGAGVSWQPTELEVTKARKLMVFLEDKRVLYQSYVDEEMKYCIESVLKIREYLVSQVLMKADQASKLYEYAKELRDGCVEFLGIVEVHKKSDMSSYRLLRTALGRLRRVFGHSLLKISLTYEIDVEMNLATIIPASPNHIPWLLDEDR